MSTRAGNARARGAEGVHAPMSYAISLLPTITLLPLRGLLLGLPPRRLDIG